MLGYPPVSRLVVQPATRDGGENRHQWLHLRHVPIAGDREPGIGFTQTPESPGVFRPRRPDVGGPISANVGRAVPRLHAGGHVEPFEARNVFWRQELYVHKLVTAVSWSVGAARVFQSVERDSKFLGHRWRE